MTSECNLDLDALLTRRSILEWRDRHLLAAEHTLLQLAVDLERELFNRIDKLEWSDLTGDVDSYVVDVLAPIVRQRASEMVNDIVNAAETELRKVSTADINVAVDLTIDTAKATGSDGLTWLIPDRIARELPNLGSTLAKASEKPAAVAGAAFNGMSRFLAKSPVNSLAGSRRNTYRDRAQALVTEMTVSTGLNPPSSLDRLAVALRVASAGTLAGQAN